jgi:hypothetical protein
MIRGEHPLYVQMDGTGIPVVKKETQDRPGKIAGQPPHTREVKLGCVHANNLGSEGLPDPRARFHDLHRRY